MLLKIIVAVCKTIFKYIFKKYIFTGQKAHSQNVYLTIQNGRLIEFCNLVKISLVLYYLPHLTKIFRLEVYSYQLKLAITTKKIEIRKIILLFVNFLYIRQDVRIAITCYQILQATTVMNYTCSDSSLLHRRNLPSYFDLINPF